MNLINYFMGIATLIASSYISIVVFFIIHRMNKETSWVTASWVIFISGLGAMGAIKSIVYVIGICDYIDPVLCVSNIYAAIILAVSPRIDVNRKNEAHN